MLVPHLPLNLRPGDQGGHRVHHDHVHRPRAGEELHDLQGLLARVGLGDQEVLHLDAEALGVQGVQGVLRIHEGGHPAPPLGLGDDGEGEGGLAPGLGAIDLHDPPPGDAADPQGEV